jgi:hypothetical protein
VNRLTVSVVRGGAGGRLSLAAAACSEHYELVALAEGVTFRIIGTAGPIEFWGWAPDYYLLNARHPEGKWMAQEETAIALHQRHLENLLSMIASGEPDYSLPESSLSALEICEAAYLSARHGVEARRQRICETVCRRMPTRRHVSTENCKLRTADCLSNGS